ncbi:uncharacterized protein EDB91DRAFT_1155925 [Suillus paluster]|uniref:uncharacterized protein n=1 Tax=Suillus paluster TaxID=48578 RepID=UPI001B85F26D|nr:uncharacterized protein EDB91DRAFT_1155925 [Suillus paluster]KAG1730988.1 hypothetical protein EDB91DRAFT_1155925 [Suillus paluster]
MFTSPFIMFALVSFLAGANACIRCPATVRVDGGTKKLHDNTTRDQFTYCNYDSVPLYLSSTVCIYHLDNGQLVPNQADFCPAAVAVKNHC